jgi:hypothetical protein
MTNPIKRRPPKGQRVVEVHTEKDYYVCGKKTNKNVWELQQLYENTQAKTTKILPEFIERIRFMVVKGICKATYSKTVDQEGELFNTVLEELINKIVPKVDPVTKKLVTKYDKTKTNLGNYILNSCYWSVVQYQNDEEWFEGLVSCGDFMEDYEKASIGAVETEIGQLKLICNYEPGNTYIPLIQSIMQKENSDVA